MNNKINKEYSHFEDDVEYLKACHDREHNPPTHLYIPSGKVYVHVCPSCKKTSRMRGNYACY